MERLNQISELRKLTGMNQEEFASLLLISRNSLAVAETDENALANNESIYYNAILTEMNNSQNELLALPEALSIANLQWKDELLKRATNIRFEAERLEQKMKDAVLKESQRRSRKLLAGCVKKVHATLGLNNDGSVPQQITDAKWLEMESTFAGDKNAGEKAHLQHLRSQFHYHMLLMEAEEAERMAEEMGE